jgi:hypothetical protein
MAHAFLQEPFLEEFMNWVRAVALVAATYVVVGCETAEEYYKGRNGPAPVVLSAEVSDGTRRQVETLQFIAANAGVTFPPNHPDDWYLLTLYGMNSVDIACDEYMSILDRIHRGKSRIQNTLNLTQATASAVMTATGADAKALLVLAQAFGATHALTGIVADSYLYSAEPSTVEMLSKRLRGSYRTQLLASRADVVALPIAWKAINDYLKYCLPPTLQVEIASFLKKAEAQAAAPQTQATDPTVQQPVNTILRVISPASPASAGIAPTLR